jgi:hypothetical protein
VSDAGKIQVEGVLEILGEELGPPAEVATDGVG